MISLKVNKVSTKLGSAPQFYYGEIEKQKFPLFSIGENSNFVGAGVNIRTSAEHQFKRKAPMQIHNIHIGSYVAVAADVDFIVGSNHNHNSVTIKNLNYDAPNYPSKGQIIIQNDVFVGYGAKIMAGVTVHNGAVIAANSHVVEDVPPYAIVGGNPAKVIKYRFSDDVIKKLQTIKWWNWSTEKKTANRNWLASSNIDAFCNEFYAEALKESKKVGLPSYADALLGRKIYLYFIDTRLEFSLWQRVIEQFYTYATSRGAGSVLVLAATAETLPDLAKIHEMIVRSLPKDAPAPFFLVGQVEDERALMSCADFYIANRDLRTVYRSELAYDYGAKILSAADHNIF